MEYQIILEFKKVKFFILIIIKIDMQFVMTEVLYGSIKITTSNEMYRSYLPAIANCPKFKNYLDTFDHSRIAIDEFRVSDVDLFARPGSEPTPSNIGFIKGKVFYRDGQPLDKFSLKPIPGNIVFIRGGSVAVFLVVTVEGTNDSYYVLCEQARVPGGRFLAEICAGMVDSSTNNIIGVALNELKEETDIKLNKDDLIHLGSIYPSPGGCDEEINLFYAHCQMSRVKFMEKHGRLFGEEGTDESISLRFIRIDGQMETMHHLLSFKDAKLNSAYIMAKARGLFC